METKGIETETEKKKHKNEKKILCSIKAANTRNRHKSFAVITPKKRKSFAIYLLYKKYAQIHQGSTVTTLEPCPFW